VLKKRSRIIVDVTKRYHKRTHKFVIEFQKSWDDFVRLDKENSNTLWQNTARKEMKNVQIAFQILNGDESVPPTYQEICCRVIFDVFVASCHTTDTLDKENGNTLWQDAVRKEMKNVRIAFQMLNGDESSPLTYQEIWCRVIFDVFVACCHTTDTPHAMTYASVVSRESVRIALTLAFLNDLDVKMADIENAYLTAPIIEKVWTVLGPEFRDDAGKRALIVRYLYGLKSAGSAFRNQVAECMKHLGWNPCRSDRDLWMKAKTRHYEGMLYWA
jgi:hypothetical protein